MMVRCIRCNTEFDSAHAHTHVCPRCHFAFTADDAGGDLEIIRTSDLLQHKTGHHLLEEAEHKCAFHFDADAIAHCACCGKPLCYACATKTDEGYFCEVCEVERKAARPQQAVEKPPPSQPETAPAQALRPARAQSISQALAARPYVPWEYRRQIGRINALFMTWKQALFSPVRFFHTMPIVGDYRGPLLYGVFWTLVGSAGGVVWRLLLFIYPTIVEFLGGKLIQISLQLSRMYVIAAVLFLLSPILALMLLLVACAIYHAFVALLARRHGVFETTLRVVCYSSSTNAFYFVPFVGALVGGLWQLVLVTVGLKEAHRISYPAAITVVLVPFTLVLVLGLAFMVWAVNGSRFAVDKLILDLIASLLG